MESAYHRGAGCAVSKQRCIGMGNVNYWSYTLVGTDGAKYMSFYNGVVNQTFMSKTVCHARPVRALNP